MLRGACVGAAILVVVGVRVSSAAVFAVSTEAQLQAALDAAEINGQDDTIQLAAGVYDTNDNGGGATFTYDVIAPAENFALTVEGAGAASTFLDGNFARRALSINANGTLRVSGLTVRNARVVSGALVQGGGAFIGSEGGSVLVENCAFTNNSTTVNDNLLFGGALALSATGGVTLQGSTFAGNQAHNPGSGDIHGGAVAILKAAAVLVADCDFISQTTQQSGTGSVFGGVLITDLLFDLDAPFTTTLTDVSFSGVGVSTESGNVTGGVVVAIGESVTAQEIVISDAQIAASGDVFAGLVAAVATNSDVTVAAVAVTGSVVTENDSGLVIGGLMFLAADEPGATASLDHVLLADNGVAEHDEGDVFGGLVLLSADLVHAADLDARRQTVTENGFGDVFGGGVSNFFFDVSDPASAEYSDIAVLESSILESGEGTVIGGFIVAFAGEVTGQRWTVAGCSTVESGDGDVQAGIAAISARIDGELEAGRFVGNSVSESGEGNILGGVLALGSSEFGEARLINSALGNNVSTEHDEGVATGGAVAGFGPLVRLVHDSIWDNALTQAGIGLATGGGISYPIFPEGSGPVLDVYNSVIWGNSAASGADIFVAEATLNLFNTDFAVLTDGGGSTINQASNLNVNPLFVGYASGDFHLTSLSPVIDQGTAAAPDMPATDFDGDPRIVPPAPDMGADEFSALAANQPPVNALPAPPTTDPGVAIVFSVAGGNPISISDPDAGANPVRVTLVASHGTLTLAGTAGLTFIVGDGTADAAMSFTGTIAAINLALDGLVFDPEPGYSGPAGLDITTNDLGNTGAGGPQSDADTLEITIASLTVAEIPAVGGWGLFLLGSGLALAAAWRLRR